LFPALHAAALRIHDITGFTRISGVFTGHPAVSMPSYRWPFRYPRGSSKHASVLRDKTVIFCSVNIFSITRLHETQQHRMYSVQVKHFVPFKLLFGIYVKDRVDFCIVRVGIIDKTIIYLVCMWSLTLREKRILTVFRNKVLRRIFGSERDKVSGNCRKLLNGEFSNLFASPNIIRMMKSRRMTWSGHVARIQQMMCTDLFLSV
jgi:hypothetical protein